MLPIKDNNEEIGEHTTKIEKARMVFYYVICSEKFVSPLTLDRKRVSIQCKVPNSDKKKKISDYQKNERSPKR